MKHEPMPDPSTSQAETGAHKLHRDFETRSTVDLTKVGSRIYANHPMTEVICAAYAVDDQPTKLWWPGDPVPAEWFEAARNPNWTACAHNDPFESNIEQFILHPRFGFPLIPSERHDCTQARSLALALPAELGLLADVLEFEHRKDAAGKKLMLMMSKPRKPRKGEDPNRIYWHEEPDQLRRLGAYCMKDVEAEREADDRLLPLSDFEKSVWVLSNTINNRGFHIDREFAEAARKIAKAAAPEIDAELAAITTGAVTGINQVEKLKRWLESQGCVAPTLDRKVIEKLLDDDELLAAPVRRALELRLGGAQAAVAKINSLLARAGADDRVRGGFKYHGTSTGRWAGEGPQAQNLKRPKTRDIGAAIAAVATGDYAHMKTLYAKPLSVVGDCSRSMITAAPGHVLIGGDFGAIESRVLAMVASEDWKLDAYRRFDATRDPRDEPYCVLACKIYRVPDGTYTKASPERNVGKTCDLAFGYMGSVGAWRNFESGKYSDEEVLKFRDEWRAAHPKTVRFWYDINDAAVNAVHERGKVLRCGMIALRYSGAFLQIKLPSGRKLNYPTPRIIEDDRGKPCVVFGDNAKGKFVDCHNGRGAYGGTWVENIISGIARDILVEAMFRVEAAGYPIVMHVHDELVCEVPTDFGSEQEFTHLMTRKPAWALELPIAASAWSGPRYCK